MVLVVAVSLAVTSRDLDEAVPGLVFVPDADRSTAGTRAHADERSNGELRVVAGDASGGTFFLCDNGPVLYADSEGGPGSSQPTHAAIRLVVGVPTWQDVVSDAPDVHARCAPPSKLPTPN
jgi:hypothetical protein